MDGRLVVGGLCVLVDVVADRVDVMTQDLTAALEQVRFRYSCTRAPITGNSPATLFASASDVPPLLAAITAVLELADESDGLDPGHPCAAMVREAISRELTRKGKP